MTQVIIFQAIEVNGTGIAHIVKIKEKSETWDLYLPYIEIKRIKNG